MAVSLKQKAIRGGFVTIIGQFIKFGLHMGSTMVLARLLVPTDYGLIAMVVAVTGFLGMLKDAGLSDATVQRDTITSQQISNLFWINIGLGVCLAGISCLLAPVWVRFYGDARLWEITIAFSIPFIFSALTVQHQALLRREMRFKALTAIDIVSMVCGIAVGIGMAVSGFGYWSLVGMPVSTTVMNMICVWVVCPWRPSWYRSGSGIRSMVHFGGYLTCQNILNYLFRNLDNILIGWYWGATLLGLYSKGYSLLLLPINQINSPVRSVAVSTLSRIQNDSPRMRRFFLGGFSIVVATILPIIAATFVYAEEVIHLILGEQWSGVVELYRYLAPAALIGAICNPLGWLMWAMGKSKQLFFITIFWSATIVTGFVVGLPYGPEGVALGFSIMSCIAVIPLCFLILRGTPVSVRDILDTIKLPILAAAIAGVGGLGCKTLLAKEIPSEALGVLGCVIIAAIYAFFLLCVFGQSQYFSEVFKQLKSGKSTKGS